MHFSVEIFDCLRFEVHYFLLFTGCEILNKLFFIFNFFLFLLVFAWEVKIIKDFKDVHVFILFSDLFFVFKLNVHGLLYHSSPCKSHPNENNSHSKWENKCNNINNRDERIERSIYNIYQFFWVNLPRKTLTIIRHFNCYRNIKNCSTFSSVWN